MSRVNFDYESNLYEAFDSDPTPVVEFLRWLALCNNLAASPHVLDVGCGPGRMFEPLSKVGWHVVGLEPNPTFLVHAKERAKPLERVSVQKGGFNDISGEEMFDLICGINSPFAHVLTPEAREDAITRAFRALRPGGLLFLDLPNLLRILKEYREPPSHVTSTVAGQLVKLTRRHELDYHTATFTTKEEYILTDRQGEEHRLYKDHPYAIISFPELSYFLRRAGFNDLKTYRSYTARKEEAIGPGRMMVVAVKSP